MGVLFKSFSIKVSLDGMYFAIIWGEEVSKSHKGYFWRIRSLFAVFLKTKID